MQMKTASKVFIIISICVSSFFLFLFFIVGIASCGTDEAGGMFAGCLLFFLFLSPTIIVGIIALYKLNKAKTKKELTVIAIITLIFCNLISGILMLCLKDEDLNPSLKSNEPTAETNAVLNEEISKIKKEMNELGITSLDEYKGYVAFAKENKAQIEEKRKKEQAEFEEFIKFRDQK